MFGLDNIKIGIYCSQNANDGQRDLEFFFPLNKRPFKTTEKCENSTLGIIKPHAIKENKTGDIILMINNSGFKIIAMKMLCMDRVNCEEFLEIYKGVVPEYTQMVLQLTNGPALAIEIEAIDSSVNVHEAFRNLCGPSDPVSLEMNLCKNIYFENY